MLYTTPPLVFLVGVVEDVSYTFDWTVLAVFRAHYAPDLINVEQERENSA